ncbi:hypothetical protein BGZ65_009520 [Modicella reniformis]|uniref:Uncharacterized protein n=1 Tax=Modicella reniformis TaxID=1440133 RepID=A0A9P6J4R0_9FUNG|nr:hypothetical protein BGZ65_009520 [Modicella reniformis]
MDQQKQLVDRTVQKMEQQVQQVEQSQQQVEEALKKIQQMDQQQQQQQQQQIEEILQKTQQMDKQTEHSHQQFQQRIEETVQKTQQMDQQKQLVDGMLQKMEQQVHQVEQSQQQMQQRVEGALQKIQQVDQQQQQQQQRIEENLQMTQQMDQQTENSHQQLLKRIEEAVQKTQQMDQQKKVIDEILQKMEQQVQQVEQSQRQIQQRVEGALQKIQQVDQQQQQQQQRIEENLQMTQQMDQQTQHSHQQLLQRIEEAVQKTQQDQQKQPIEEILQKIYEEDQQAEQSQQQAQQYIKESQQVDQQQQQQQIEEVLERTQQMDQQAQHSHQPQIVEIQQKMLQMDQQAVYSSQQMLQCIESSQKTWQMDQDMHRVQATLNMSFQETPVPRLFIVLPKTTATFNKQGKLCSSQFRLYYLCECGSHTMGRFSSGTQVIHVTKHAGYDLVNPNEFFDKYGTYLLTMMYMVKYGANADGLKVPPLLGLDLANEVEAGQEHLNFIKKNINHLVNDTILYLEETIGVTIGDLGASAYQELGILDLEQLKSYLRGNKGKRVTGELCRTITRDGKCVWVCSEHQLEYHQSTMQWLEKIITTSGGSYCEEAGEVKIKITSDELAKRFYDGMIKVCGIQSARNVLSPTVFELKLDFNGSIKNPTAGIITIHLNDLNSLSLDFERHSMTSVISQGEVKDVDMKIARLGDLTLDNFEFIKQCYTVRIEILHTPQQADEDLLASILHHIFMLKEFHIRCLDERSLATIDLVISTRENIFQSGGSLALRTFKLMAEGETHIKRVSGKYHNSIEAMVTFDMKADIQLQRQHLVVNDDPVCEFTRRYGWSIKTLVLPWAFSDYLAIVLNESSDERGSQIITGGLRIGSPGSDYQAITAFLKYNIWNLSQGNGRVSGCTWRTTHKSIVKRVKS